MELPIKNDAIVLGLLILILAVVFKTESSNKKGWKKFYSIVPSLLLCYFIPSIFNSLGIISGEESNLYFVASRYLLPASLILLCLNIDFKGIKKLGPKAIIMFLTGTVGIIIGGPISIYICKLISPDFITQDLWKGLATVAGSWIGGGANQTAMKEIYECSDDLFSAMITVDVIVANVWMAVLLAGAGNHKKVNKWLKADNSAIDELQIKMENYQSKISRIPSLSDIMMILAIGLGGTAVAHLLSGFIQPLMEETIQSLYLKSFTKNFFWLVVIATSIGLILSFTKAKKYEGAGASRIGSLFLYILIASIGMKMDVTAIFDNLGLFMIGGIWMLIHAIILIVVAKLIKAPFFFVAVGSQANVGGAASAPIVASAFSPVLAPVGVLLAVFGYVLGTYGAIVCAMLMQSASI